MRYTGPKNRIARREGMDLGLKTPGSKAQARLLKKVGVPPGQHGANSRRKMSERGRQLREAQKLRHIFGLSSSQLKKYFTKAVGKTGNTALFLSQFLERRMDNVVYRLGLAPTRAAARQLIVHKHMKVNKQVVGVPSYQLKIGEVVSFADESSVKIPWVEKAIAVQDIILPIWLEKKAIAGKLIDEPKIDIIEKQVNLRLVIEYFSR